VSAFKVGGVAVGCNYVTLPDRNGMQCQVLAPLQVVTAFECGVGADTTKPRYHVRWADGLESFAQPHTLRRRSAKVRLRTAARQEMIDCLHRAKRTAYGGAYA
jgi:hypothetical protein